jgi:hypothetical protein
MARIGHLLTRPVGCPADLIAEARDMAEAGDEEGCVQKLTEVKSLLGMDRVGQSAARRNPSRA